MSSVTCAVDYCGFECSRRVIIYMVLWNTVRYYGAPAGLINGRFPELDVTRLIGARTCYVRNNVAPGGRARAHGIIFVGTTLHRRGDVSSVAACNGFATLYIICYRVR